jgi:hypothetical protein
MVKVSDWLICEVRNLLHGSFSFSVSLRGFGVFDGYGSGGNPYHFSRLINSFISLNINLLRIC